MNLESLTESLKHEFLCYYHADLIPANWQNKDVAHGLAFESAARLVRVVEQKEDLIDLLKILIANRSHPLNESLAEETDIEWDIEEEDWFGYKALLEGIIKYLKAY
jgi:hypothetical protein